ncbi:sigma 54-interacting transcriptional regulator [Thioflexithrix psekupsensis]|uniref:Sigma-54-dependent Fis family transcriptional regulator n=1 Tax=Thioflexithrix psekupsensis TaxID=1570016 RepID=A0A251XAN0_9GAMM|nr:sigma 54-interacting transcriptional regulator [Thioflexithrix psekupsensis]OUD15429.1 hypothetical protein TPSD3_02560 [Thioflexithrix psekupsensis]
MGQKKPLCLLVDDQKDILTLFSLSLASIGIESHLAQSLSEAYIFLERNNYDLCISDLSIRMGGEGREGLDLVEYIKKHFPFMPIIVMTAYGEIPTAVRALQLGAYDFVCKEVMPQQLCDLAQSALKRNLNYQKKLTRLIGESPVIEKLRDDIQRVAHTQAAVFISGESGVGKEVVAQLIHSASNRSEAPFVPLNCGAISGELIESELFGHKKGAFTGAYENKKGLFKEADKGTLFLDEIGDLSYSAQIKLLRAIQERAIRPVGSNKEETVDVRILSASHRNLKALIENNSFRKDLFFRINVIEVRVPPLRERIGDVRLLIDHFLKRLRVKNDQPKLDISEAAIKVLEQYDFPGNVRELENLLEAASVLCRDECIRPDDLRLSPPQERPTPAPNPRLEKNPKKIAPQKINITTNKWNNNSFLEQILTVYASSHLTLPDMMESIYCVLIKMAMEYYANGQRKSADFLELTENSLRYRSKACEEKKLLVGNNVTIANQLRVLFGPFFSPETPTIPIDKIVDELEKRMIKSAIRNHKDDLTKISQQLGISVNSLRYRIERKYKL